MNVLIKFCFVFAAVQSHAVTTPQSCGLSLSARSVALTVAAVLAATPASAAKSGGSSSSSPRSYSAPSRPATGRVGSAPPVKLNYPSSGRPVGRLQTQVYKVLPKAILLGGAIVATKNVLSTRPKTDDTTTPSRLRANIARPLNAPHTLNFLYAMDEGYLAPTMTNLVFSPVYFWFPFNIFHPREVAAAASNPTLADDYTNTPYTEGEIGSAALNGAPEDVQAELRLMQTKQSEARPEDPQIKIADQTDDEWEAQVRLLKDRLSELKRAKQDADRALAKHLEAAVLSAEIVEADTSLSRALNEQSQAQPELAREGAEVEYAQSRVTADIDVLGKSEAQSSWCSRWGWHLLCHFITRHERENLSRDEEQLMEHREALRRIKVGFDGSQLLKAFSEQNRMQAAEDLAALNLPAVGDLVSIKAHRLQILDEIQSTRDALIRLIGFVSSPIPNRACEHPARYRFTPEVSTNLVNPLFDRPVEAELTPNPATDLRVCLDSQGRLSQVHVFDGARELFHSEILRLEGGPISEIKIWDADNQILEDHRWTAQNNGVIRYALTFRTGDGPEDLKSIYSDITP